MPAATSAGAQAIDTLGLENHARFLADDLLEGRGPGSRGERIAALYITTRLRALGLLPLPSATGYRLPVPLTAVHADNDQTTARIQDLGRERVLRPSAFYPPGGSEPSFRNFAGELLLAGPASGALRALEAYKNLTGKVIVLTPPWAGVLEAEQEILRRGAAGAVELIPNGAVYERLRIVRGPTRYFLPAGIEDPANQSSLPRLIGGPEMIEALGLAQEVLSRRALEQARSLGRHLEVTLPFRVEAKTGYNVAGYIPGADPALREEWILYVAHYDHVGFGEPASGDSIWNGFIDNAAGSAMLLEIARVLAADPPARSVAFLWVTAEEQGLLGSNWFVHQPKVPLNRIRAVLNLDGGAPPAPPVSWGIVGADASPEGAVARKIVESHGWSVRSVAFGPESDHWPFHLAGVPTLMLFPGSELDGLTAEETEALNVRWHRPHTPADEWHPDFPFSGLRRYAELALEIGRALAARDSLPNR